MKLDYDNTLKIKDWLCRNNKQPNANPLLAFEYYLAEQYYGKITNSVSVTNRIKVIKKQIDFIQKSIVNIMYELNGKTSKGLRYGYVYAIDNPAWKDYVKIGCAIDVYDRLASYQTSSPHRDYELIEYVFTEDRIVLENAIHNSFETKGEWVKASRSEIKEFILKFKRYPEQEIFKFALKESINCSLKNAKGKLTKVSLKSVLKQYAIGLGEYLNVDPKVLYSVIESKKGISKTGNGFSLNAFNIKFEYTNHSLVMQEN